MMGEYGRPTSWDVETDVLIVGCGYSGGIAAIEATDAGADVLILEKMPVPGGISICSGGGVRTTSNSDSAFQYLKRTCDGMTPDDVLLAMAKGMEQVPAYMEELAKINGAKILDIDYPGNYPFPGFQDLGFCMYGKIPDFDQLTYYPHVRGLRGGARHFKVIEDNLARRNVEVRLNTSAERLVRSPDGAVLGLWASSHGTRFSVKARRGVVLACGGFEAAEDMKRQFLQGTPMQSAAFRGNTGDGIRMAQEAGASLWHMWNIHGTYGFRHSDPDYPFGIRLNRLPDWNLEVPRRDGMEMAWILVDQRGRRYMNEYPPYWHDTGHRPMELYDPASQSYLRIPSFMIFDEEGRKLYPFGAPTFNDPDVFIEWSEDNLAEVDLGMIKVADSIGELAAGLGMNAEILQGTIDRWNSLCARGEDPDFGRLPETMVPITHPPYYHAPMWPIISNTQGGPVHNEHWQVLSAFGEPIPGLYEAGELGGIFGHLYVAGGNLAECYVGGWTAGRHAAGNRV